MSTPNTAEQQIPVGSGPMIVFGSTACVIGVPGQVHGEFYARVKHEANKFNAEGRPNSGDNA